MKTKRTANSHILRLGNEVVGEAASGEERPQRPEYLEPSDSVSDRNPKRNEGCRETYGCRPLAETEKCHELLIGGMLFSDCVQDGDEGVKGQRVWEFFVGWRAARPGPQASKCSRSCFRPHQHLPKRRQRRRPLLRRA
jgi:hypothetical protein